MNQAPDLSGKWELDLERSDSLYSHMKAMGCEEIAAMASEKLQITVSIVQTPFTIALWQRSQLGVAKRVLHLNGNETKDLNTAFERFGSASVGPTELVIKTRFEFGRLLDRRSVVENGKTMLQILDLDARGVAKTTRYYKKIASEVDAATLAEISAETETSAAQVKAS